MLRTMAEMCVTASELRGHFKELANQIARGGDVVVVSRHGYEMLVLVSVSDYRKLLRVKKAEPETPLEHPDSMSTQEVERHYAATQGATDPETITWRSKAALLLWLRKGRPNVTPPS
jgi:prevent-host-death family protein